MGITLHLVDTKCSSSINMKFFVLASLCAAASAEAYYGGYGYGGLRTYGYGPARYGAYRGIYKREAEADAEAYYGNYGYSGLTGYGAGYGYGARTIAAAPVYGYLVMVLDTVVFTSVRLMLRLTTASTASLA